MGELGETPYNHCSRNEEGPTLEEMGNAETTRGTKDCKAREEGAKNTCGADDGNPWLVSSFGLVAGSWLVVGSWEPSLEAAFMRYLLVGGNLPPLWPPIVVVGLF